MRSDPRLARETASAGQPKAQVKAFRDHPDTTERHERRNEQRRPSLPATPEPTFRKQPTDVPRTRPRRSLASTFGVFYRPLPGQLSVVSGVGIDRHRHWPSRRPARRRGRRGGTALVRPTRRLAVLWAEPAAPLVATALSSPNRLVGTRRASQPCRLGRRGGGGSFVMLGVKVEPAANCGNHRANAQQGCGTVGRL